MDYLVRAGSLEGFESLVLSLGENPVELIDQVGLSTSSIRDPDALISYPKMAQLLELAATRCNCSTFGLQLSVNQGLFTVGTIGLYMAQQTSILESLRMAIRYVHMHAQGAIVTLTPINNGYQFSYQVAFAGRVNTEQLCQLSVALLYRMLKTMVGEQWEPKKILFAQDKASTNLADFNALLTCPIEFNANSNAMILHQSTLALKPNADQQQLKQYIARHFQMLEQRHPNNLEAKICHGIRALLPTGDCTLKNIAAMLDIHPRVLQKKLQQKQQCFSELLEETRSEIACELMARSHISLTELALQLGYAELAVFSRSFKKRHGISPSTWRKQQII